MIETSLADYGIEMGGEIGKAVAIKTCEVDLVENVGGHCVVYFEDDSQNSVVSGDWVEGIQKVNEMHLKVT